jgi:C4-dicarboxylate transporter DctQ subunit
MRKFLDMLDYVEEALVAMAILLVAVIDFVSIVTRGIGIQTGEAQEVMLLMFVWITFLGIPMATKRKAHLGLSMLVDSLPLKAQRYVSLVTLATVLFFLGTLFYYGVQMTLQEYRTGQTTPSLGLPAWPFGAVVPLSALLTTIRFLETGYFDWIAGKAREEAK